jgi:hypothetical protein
MRGLMGFLVKAKLVEPDRDSASAPDVTSEPLAAKPTAADSPPGELAAPPLGSDMPSHAEVQENVPFDEIYQQAGLPPSPFPAEKLLRLLDGLRSMDASTRKAAVLAMDAADDNWSIVDPVDDAQRKIAALMAFRQGLAEQLEASAQQAGDRIADGKHALENAVAEIRSQIAQLEQLLEREITRSAQEIATIEAGRRAAREAVAREQRRLDQEIERLGEIPASYSGEPRSEPQ